MGLWKIWLAGLVITAVTSKLLHKNTKINRILMDILIGISIIVVGGIPEGWVLSWTRLNPIATFIITSLLIWMVGLCVLFYDSFDLYDKSKNVNYLDELRFLEVIVFIAIYIIASLCWCKLFISYNSKIEDINETIVIDKQEHELLSFNGIPLQQISGSVSGDVSGTILGTDGEISGSIFTSEELPYWYIDENGDGKYDSVPTNNSTLRFIAENEEPYIVVTTYREQTRTINYNNGEEAIVIHKEWSEYIFYLPQAIIG